MTKIEGGGTVENFHTHREEPWGQKGEFEYVVRVEKTKTTTTETNPEGFVSATAKGSRGGYRRKTKESEVKTRPFFKFPRDADGNPFVPKDGFAFCLQQKLGNLAENSKWDADAAKDSWFEITELIPGKLRPPTELGPVPVTLKKGMGMQYQMFECMDYVKFKFVMHTRMDEAKATAYVEKMNDQRFGPTNRGIISIEVQ